MSQLQLNWVQDGLIINSFPSNEFPNHVITLKGQKVGKHYTVSDEQIKNFMHIPKEKIPINAVLQDNKKFDKTFQTYVNIYIVFEEWTTTNTSTTVHTTDTQIREALIAPKQPLQQQENMMVVTNSLTQPNSKIVIQVERQVASNIVNGNQIVKGPMIV
jgi:hypothetical protein